MRKSATFPGAGLGTRFILAAHASRSSLKAGWGTPHPVPGPAPYLAPMTDSSKGSGNEAERMQDAYAQRQEHERETGETSAGGAGSTGTPGNAETGAETTDAEDGGARSGATES